MAIQRRAIEQSILAERAAAKYGTFLAIVALSDLPKRTTVAYQSLFLIKAKPMLGMYRPQTFAF